MTTDVRPEVFKHDVLSPLFLVQDLNILNKRLPLFFRNAEVNHPQIEKTCYYLFGVTLILSHGMHWLRMINISGEHHAAGDLNVTNESPLASWFFFLFNPIENTALIARIFEMNSFFYCKISIQCKVPCMCHTWRTWTKMLLPTIVPWCLVGVWNMNFIFHFIYGIILPIDELIFFKMVLAPPTR